MPELLQQLHDIFTDGQSTDHIALLIIVSTILGIFIAWNASPWRSLLAWIATFSIQFSAGSFHLSLSDLFILPLGIGAFMSWMRSRNRGFSIPLPVTMFVILFLVWGNLVTAFTLGTLPKWTWLNKDLGLIALVIPYCSILILCRDRSRSEKLIQTFVSAVSIINFGGLLLYVGSLFLGFQSTVNYGGMRFEGFMLDPNSYAGLVAVTAILQFSILNFKPKGGFGTILQLLNCCLLVTGCLLTLSRGGLLALIAGALVLVYLTNARSVYIVACALLAIALAVIWLSARTDLSTSIERRANERDNIDSRIDYIKQGLQMYLSSPISVATGIGIGTFIEESPRYFGDQHQIHNTYVWLLVEGGPLIFGAYLLILYRSLKQNLWIYRHVPSLRYAASGCFCALITIIIWCSGVEGTYHHHVWILFAFSELLWAASRQSVVTRQHVRTRRDFTQSYARAF
ncbi:MAG TPA: O-antigen ligase family protein [Terriglobales bacterium]|nr:O-antigen ligase family protein [Terriglobales bacterium]